MSFDREASRRAIAVLHPGNRLRLMAGYPLLPQPEPYDPVKHPVSLGFKWKPGSIIKQYDRRNPMPAMNPQQQQDLAAALNSEVPPQGMQPSPPALPPKGSAKKPDAKPEPDKKKKRSGHDIMTNKDKKKPFGK